MLLALHPWLILPSREAAGCELPQSHHNLQLPPSEDIKPSQASHPNLKPRLGLFSVPIKCHPGGVGWEGKYGAGEVEATQGKG